MFSETSQKTCKTKIMLDACEDERKDRVESSIQLQIDRKEMKQICLFHRRWGGWIVALLLSGGAMAQEASDTITDRIHQIDDIERLGIQDMADAVRRFAGAQVRDYGGIGGLKTVSVRNMGAAHTAVSYDGVTVSNCQAGQIDIGRFSLDNVSMVTLAVGQTDDLLQTARHYASAGVLSIETEKPHFDEGRRYALRARVSGGSFGYITPSLRWWQQLGNRTRLAVDGSFMRADGNYPFTLVNGKYVTQERRNNSDILSGQGEANLYHTFKDNSELDVKAYYYRSRRGLPGAVTLYNPLSDERLWDENIFVQTRYKKHGLCRYRANTIMAGTATKTKERNILTAPIANTTSRMNTICRHLSSTVRWKDYPFPWHRTTGRSGEYAAQHLARMPLSHTLNFHQRIQCPL